MSRQRFNIHFCLYDISGEPRKLFPRPLYPTFTSYVPLFLFLFVSGQNDSIAQSAEASMHLIKAATQNCAAVGEASLRIQGNRSPLATEAALVATEVN